jgi:hypothetical protein
MTRRLLLAPAAALLLAAPAQAATKTLSSPRAVDRDCTAKVLTGRSGVTTTRFVAPAEGVLTARLRGTGDWDLAAFDRKGRLIAGSSAFAANEMVQANLRPGARITLQACRASGRAKSATLTTGFAGFDFESLNLKGPVSMVEVPLTGAWQIDALERLGLDVTHDIHDGHARVMLYGDADRAILERTGIGFKVVQADVLAAERRFRAQDRRAAARGRSALPTGRTEYRSFEDVQKELKDMADQFPDLVRPFTLKTKSFEGRDIQALEIGTGADSDDDTKPALFLNGIHHAREWPATEVIMEFAWDLLKNHGSDPQLDAILKNTRIILQPYTNVDGFIVSRGSPNLIDPDSDANLVYSTATGVVLLGGSLEYKRKNCNPYPAVDPSPVCEHKLGTDNNRNYPHTWGGVGASSNPNDQSYRGEAPGSEPETKAVQELQLSLNAPVLISMHNIAAKVLRPPGTKAEGLAPDEEGLKELGRRMADPTGYANEYGWQLYDVTGGTKDWSYAVTGAFGYTIETGPSNGDFHGSYQSVVIDQYQGKGERAGRGMREALIAAAEWTRMEKYNSRIAGRAPAGRTLRITKSLTTLSSPVCAVAGVNPLNVDIGDECIQPGGVIETPEKMDFSTQVPANGNFTWWMNPSTRPYAKAPETYHLTCEQGGTVLQEMDVTVARGQTLDLDLPCGGTLPPRVTQPTTGGGSGGGTAGGTGTGTGAAPAAGVATLKIGAVKRSGRKVKVALSAQGGTLHNLVVTLLKGRRAIGKAKLADLAGARTIVIKPKGKVARGVYTVKVTATGAKPVAKRLKLK